MEERFVEELGIPPLTARILFSRGIRTVEDAKSFLYPELKDLSDPYLLPDMEQAVLRVVEAISKGEKICVYGDYDADGVSSCAITANFFRSLNRPLEFYIPTREEGYGINRKSLEKLKEKGISLLIALDLGTTNFEEISFAKSLGIDTIVIDHHEVKNVYPPAFAFVNPKREDSLFPTRELAACGVTFFFLIALRRELAKRKILDFHINLKKELDLVTLGTLADMVPLVGDNRLLTKFGLEMMKRWPRQWLKSFYLSKILPDGRLDNYSLNFVIIPRINAPGRILDAKRSLHFLTEEDPLASLSLLRELDEANRKRQKIEEKILEEIEAHLSEGAISQKKGLVLFSENWHIGVLGIVAQRIVESYGKPAIVLTSVDGVIKGSGRGTEKLNLYECLCALSPLLLKYGGHKYACGLSLQRENLELFSQSFDSLVGSYTSGEEIKKYDTDADFDELSREVLDSFELLGPFGPGNPPPRILLFPERIYESGGRLKIIDKRKRVWYGFIQKGKGPIPERVFGVIATPVLKEEMGEDFINLLIQDFLHSL